MAIMTSIVNEFAVLVPECDTTKAAHVANNLVQNISNHSFASLEGKSLGRITISCGVATYEGDLNVFVAEADKHLFAAKTAGKGLVVAQP
jgi:diguanylate cyclase (GGDEF)-like protein